MEARRGSRDYLHFTRKTLYRPGTDQSHPKTQSSTHRVHARAAADGHGPASTGCKLPPPAREQEPTLPPGNPCSTVPSDPAQTLRIRGLDRKPPLPTARRNGVSPGQWSPRAKTKSRTAGSGVRVCRVKSQWYFPRPKRVPRRAAGVSDLSPAKCLMVPPFRLHGDLTG